MEMNVFLEINACAYGKSISEMGNLTTGVAAVNIKYSVLVIRFKKEGKILR